CRTQVSEVLRHARQRIPRRIRTNPSASGSILAVIYLDNQFRWEQTFAVLNSRTLALHSRRQAEFRPRALPLGNRQLARKSITYEPLAVLLFGLTRLDWNRRFT